MEYHPETVDLRRRIHRRPELGLHLPETQAAILTELEPLGLDVQVGRDLSSVIATLRTDRPGPTVLLRADMDALPMREDTGLEFASTVAGAAHSCGHDSHVAMLCGALRVLSDVRERLCGTVVGMFQPGEEGFHGARVMLDEGLLDATGDVDLAFAIHQTPNQPAGSVSTKSGTMLASADEFTITVRGRGGHASMPYLALDPIPGACEIVLALQSMVTRRVDVFDPAVVTIGRIESGTTTNVIPETAFIEGTVRTISRATRALVHGEIERVCVGVGAAHGLDVDFELIPGFPVTVNDDAVSRFVLDVAGELVGTEHVFDLGAPVMGAEDFSYILERVPGAMAFLGTRPEGVHPADVAPTHSNRMILNEDALDTGIALYCAVAVRRLLG